MGLTPTAYQLSPCASTAPSRGVAPIRQLPIWCAEQHRLQSSALDWGPRGASTPSRNASSSASVAPPEHANRCPSLRCVPTSAAPAAASTRSAAHPPRAWPPRPPRRGGTRRGAPRAPRRRPYPQHPLLHVASCHAHRGGLDDGVHQRPVHFVQVSDDAALVHLAHEVRRGGVRGGGGSSPTPTPSGGGGGSCRCVGCRACSGVTSAPHAEIAGLVLFAATRHAALRLDASVRAPSTGTNSLQQKLLGLATGQDHRAASTRHVVSVPCLSPARHP
jgi:hypothetical protein